MAEQWLREWNLTVGGSGGSITLSSSKDPNALRMKFLVRQDTNQSPNTAIIRVYNVSRSTAQKLLRVEEFSKVTLTAGYQQNSGKIFGGNVKQVRYGRENPTDTYVDLFCGDGDHAYIGAVVNKTLAAGSTMLDHVHLMADAMKPFGIILGYVPTQLLSQIKEPRAVTFFGMARQYLRTIAHTIGSMWSIQDGSLVIVEPGKALGGTRELNSNTGLIGMPEQTSNGITATMLIDPQVGVYSTIHLNQADVQRAAYDLSNQGAVANSTLPDVTADGQYIIYALERHGDSRGQEWYQEMICIAVGQSIPAGSVLRNYPSTAGVAGGYEPSSQPYFPEEI